MRGGVERAQRWPGFWWLLVEVSWKSQVSLQFGVRMEVQKQPRYRSPQCCHPGRRAAPSAGARAEVGSGHGQRGARGDEHGGLRSVARRREVCRGAKPVSQGRTRTGTVQRKLGGSQMKKTPPNTG